MSVDQFAQQSHRIKTDK